MKPNKQDFFNQFRENVIIEVVQALAKSQAGAQIAFKGGTALRLFYDLPRFSEDVNYDFLCGISVDKLLTIIKDVFKKKKWEITDAAVKYHTVLSELRFSGPERNFHVKIEISTREKALDTTILSLRGVAILTLEPSFLMTEKLLTFIERQAGRDIFDAWFILKNGYPLKESMIAHTYGDELHLYQTILDRINAANPQKIYRDTGKLLGYDHRNWMKTGFLEDFKRLVGNKIESIQNKKHE